jgi:hypothetical protein
MRVRTIKKHKKKLQKMRGLYLVSYIAFQQLNANEVVDSHRFFFVVFVIIIIN